MFELYNDCKSTGKLKDTLKERGITTRSGKEWKVGALNNLLRRITYIGKFKHKDNINLK
ncbi:MAG: recombinase family protein [Brevinema sp.]